MKATHMQFGCKLITNTHRQSELPEHPFDGGPGQEGELDLVRGGGGLGGARTIFERI